jgi:predicted hotdog family 3-hydroxylacyl-ACP dehydratase
MDNDILNLIPHRPPMVMIDSVEETGEASVRAAKTFAPGDFGTDGEQVIEPVLVECLAQAVAAIQGIEARKTGNAPAAGMLVGIDGFEIKNTAVTGIPIEITVEITRKFGPFAFAEGALAQDGKTLAHGSLKFYIEGGESEAP